MVTINCTHYEKNEFIRFLEELKEYKRNFKLATNEKFDTTKYDIERINILIDRVNGNYKECYIQDSKEHREKSGRIREKKDVIDPQKLFEGSLY